MGFSGITVPPNNEPPLFSQLSKKVTNKTNKQQLHVRKKTPEVQLLTVEEDEDDDIDFDNSLNSSSSLGEVGDDASFVSFTEPSPMGLCTLFEVGLRNFMPGSRCHR